MRLWDVDVKVDPGSSAVWGEKQPTLASTEVEYKPGLASTTHQEGNTDDGQSSGCGISKTVQEQMVGQQISPQEVVESQLPVHLLKTGLSMADHVEIEPSGVPPKFPE